MARIKFKGLDAYMAKLSALERASSKVAGAAIYAGAEVVADSMRAALESLPTSQHRGADGVERPWFGTPGHLARGPSQAQKEGLLESFGVTPIETGPDGVINAHIGFNGYNSVRSSQWPKGEPNVLVARAVESGTTFMEKHEVFKKTVAKVRKKANQAMEHAAEAEINKIMK